MNNIIFNNNIQVNITKNPEFPIEGDTVVFTATAIVANVSDHTVPDTYFFNYSWMVSQDGGVTYYAIGEDLETLTIPNISKRFFNNLYKIQVSLIDLENIILTENGDNLTTQFGQILIGDNSSNIGNVPSNNAVVLDAPFLNGNVNLEALNLVNLDNIIDEASEYDTTLNDINKAIVLAGQIQDNRNIQTLNGPVLTQSVLSPLPDLEITVPTSVLYIQNNEKKFSTRDAKKEVDCAIIDYQECFSDNTGPYTLTSCPGCGGNGDTVCKSLSSFINDEGRLIVEPILPYSYGTPIGSIPNATIETIAGPRTTSCCPDYKEDCEKCCAKDIPACTDGPGKGGCEEKVPRTNKAHPPAFVTGDAASAAWQQYVNSIAGGSDTIQFDVVVKFKPKQNTPPITNALGLLGGKVAEVAKGDKCGCNTWWYTRPYNPSEFFYNPTRAGENAFKFEVVCPTMIYLQKVQCKENEIITLQKNQTISKNEFPGISYACTCESNNKGDGRDSLSGYIEINTPRDGTRSKLIPPSCTYYVQRQCASQNVSCTCVLDNETTVDPSISRTYLFQTGKVGELDYNIQFPEFKSCYEPTGCKSECKGINCCGSTERTIWTLSGPSSTEVLCKESTTIDTVDIGKCSDTSTNTYIIDKYTLTQSFRDCDQKADNEKTFDTEDAAKATIKKPAVLKTKYFKNNSEAQKKAETAYKLKSKPNNTNSTLVEYVTTDTKYQPLNLGLRCSKCKIIYQISYSNPEYPCNDTNGPGICGIYNQCNVDSADTTDITLATISKIDKPTDIQLIQAETEQNNLYDDLGKAIAAATKEIGDGAGIICSG